MYADLEGCRRQLPVQTNERPDLVLWCEKEKEIHLVELTVPHEDNIAEAHERKKKKYEGLLKRCEEEDWRRALLFPIEVGCRGFVGTSVRRWLKVAGLGHRESNRVVRRVQETAEKTGHWIWVKREDGSWDERVD